MDTSEALSAISYPARSLVGGLIVMCALSSSITSLRAEDQPAPGSSIFSFDPASEPAYDKGLSVRGGFWLVSLEADLADNEAGADLIDVEDLGFDDSSLRLTGQGNLRYGRHDFWVTADHYDETNEIDIPIDVILLGVDAGIGAEVETNISFTDIKFGYGYSFFTFEEDGFRLGPTASIAYTNIAVEIAAVEIAGEQVTGLSGEVEETLPVPTVGVHGEVPLGNVVLEADLNGFFLDAGEKFDGGGIRFSTIATWRPWEHFGVYGGLNVIYADVTVKELDIESTLVGPVMGVEFRF